MSTDSTAIPRKMYSCHWLNYYKKQTNKQKNPKKQQQKKKLLRNLRNLRNGMFKTEAQSTVRDCFVRDFKPPMKL